MSKLNLLPTKAYIGAGFFNLHYYCFPHITSGRRGHKPAQRSIIEIAQEWDFHHCRAMRPGQRKSRYVQKSTPGQAALTRGLGLMVIAMFIAPAMDVIAKYLSGSINGIQVAQVRFAFQAVFLLPFIMLLKGSRSLMPRNLMLNTIRALVMATAITFFFTALKWMPVADAIAVFFVEPLILTILSGLFLGEKIGWPRRIAVLVGFIGALILVRPSYEVFGLVSLFPLGAAFLFAIYLILTSKLSKREDPLTMQFYSGLVGFVSLTIAIAIGEGVEIASISFNWPTPLEWFLLACAGFIGTVVHLMIVYAFQAAPASVLAPMNYLEIVSATALGYFIFGDFPDPLKWLGIAIIVASGMFVFWRESRTQPS